jgi:hypothetical protein
MRTVAIPFIRGGYLNFWKIVRMDDALYSRALWTNHSIVRIDGRTSEQAEAILKAEKTRLIRERWDIAKAKASCRIFQAEKTFWKELSVANIKQGTITL